MLGEWITPRRCLAVIGLAAFLALLLTLSTSNNHGILRPWTSNGDESPFGGEEDVGDLIKQENVIEEETKRGVVIKEGEADEPQAEETSPAFDDSDDEEDEGGYEPAPRTHYGPYNDIQKGEKYFLFSPSGGFNNQREELVNAMEIARLLNRTLYVPMAGKHTNFFSTYERLSGAKDLFPMDRILDFPYMETYGIRLVPLNTTVLRMASRFAKQLGPNSVEILYHPESPSPISNWNMQTVLSFRSIKKPLLFIRGKGFYHRWFATSLMTKIRKHTRYSTYLRQLSMKIVNASLGNTFYAFHIRLGDYRAAHPDVVAFVNGFVGSARARGWKTKKYPLYIATDDVRKSQEEFGLIYNSFSNIYFAEKFPKEMVNEFRSLFPPKSQMKNDMMGILEQLICAQATDFIGSGGSTFSAWIMFMRALRKYTFPEVGSVGLTPSSAAPDGTSNPNTGEEDKSKPSDSNP